MKKFRKLIPALAMLLVSAVLMSTASYAWFSMNTQVTANGMQVKAVAEDGILISNSDKSAWTNSASAKISSAILVPTSTSGTKNPSWVHNTSVDADSSASNQAASTYADLSLKWSNTTFGEGYVDLNTNSTKDSNEKAYVLLNEFYIKSSGAALELGNDKTYKDLYINDVAVTGAAHKIDNALRVLVVIGNTAYIYAPVNGVDSGTATLTYNFKETTSVTALLASSNYDKTTGTTSIGNTNETAVKAQVYIYFEGEDLNCKSTNISGIATTDLAVTINFGIVKTHS
jgi:hypothetical protein